MAVASLLGPVSVPPETEFFETMTTILRAAAERSRLYGKAGGAAPRRLVVLGGFGRYRPLGHPPAEDGREVFFWRDTNGGRPRWMPGGRNGAAAAGAAALAAASGLDPLGDVRTFAAAGGLLRPLVRRYFTPRRNIPTQPPTPVCAVVHFGGNPGGETTAAVEAAARAVGLGDVWLASDSPGFLSTATEHLAERCEPIAATVALPPLSSSRGQDAADVWLRSVCLAAGCEHLILCGGGSHAEMWCILFRDRGSAGVIQRTSGGVWISGDVNAPQDDILLPFS